MVRALSRFAMAALLATAIIGCAEERDPIDRVQPNALPKSLFQGEWYYQQTVVDIPGTWSATFVGETNWLGMERIRFDIQQDWLYVRRSFERIKDAEGVEYTAEGLVDMNGRPYLGAVIAAYPITSHFDIRRAYNPTTGEEYNVLEENSWDRPWYERDYIRVDWSMNHATNFGFLVDDMMMDPVAYYVQDTDLDADGLPDDPDYPVIDAGEFGEDGSMLRQPYIDITNMFMTQPGMTYFEELGETYPTCWLFSRATSDCTTEPIKIRSSFLRVDPNRQYVPKPFKGKVTDFFGLFTQDRMVYSDKWEVPETLRERYANLHNLWVQWYDGTGNLIPEAQREVRPMVYYVHNWPESLEGTLRSVEEDWNQIFQDAVTATGNPYVGTVLKFCHTPVRADEDHDLCGAEGFTARLGDVRYSWIAYMPKYYDGFALLGLGPSNSDPLTGEIISSGAYLYIYNDIVSQSTTEMVQLLNGDLDPNDYINGTDLGKWQAEAAKGGRSNRIVSQTEKEQMVQAQDYSWALGISPRPTDAQLATLNGTPGREIIKQLAPALYDQGLFNGDMDDSDGRLRSLQGTYIEDLMVNPEMMLASGIMPGGLDNFSDEVMKKSSIARTGPFRIMQALENKRRYWANVKNVDLMDTADDGYFGLAEQWKGMGQDEIRAGIKDQVYHAVLTHELGHSFNLHHNFGGTEDVLNYQDQYWQLRTADGTVGPRWTDPITDAELRGNIYRYSYSSIMDYSRLTLDYGPGKYDRAAVLIGYANKVEVYLNTGTVASDPDNRLGEGALHEWSTSDGQIVTFWSDGPKALHYTKWYQMMDSLIWEPSNRRLVDASTVDWTSGYSLDGGVFMRVPYIFCSPYQSDIGNNCFTRDYGADEYERVQHHLQVANTWYITRAFPRFQVGASVESYLGRTYERTYRRAKGYNDLYALYGGIFTQIYTNQQIQDFLTDDLTGWASYSIAIHDQVNFLLTTIAMPDIAGYEPQVDPAGQAYLGKSLFSGAPYNTDVVGGRYFTTTWWDDGGDDACGMYWWECLHHFGFYLDKMMALEALTDAQTYFVARDTAEDIREWRINFYDNYGPVIENFLGGLLAQDWQDFAPRMNAAGDVVHPDYANPAAPMPAGQALDAGTGFTVQLYAAVLGMARLQNNFDKSFLDSTRMWMQGSGFAVDTTLGTVTYVDPAVGRTYVAINLPNGVAKRMILRANAVKARSNSCVSGCVAGLTVDDKARADAELIRYTQTLDLMVDLTGYYETFTQSYGDPYDPGSLP